MFNLMMFSVDWISGRVTVPVGRMFEYTDDHVAERFGGRQSPKLDLLAELPCLFWEEGRSDEAAYIGQIIRARNIGRDVSLEVSIDSDVPRLRNALLYERRSEIGIRNDLEFSRNHWAVKDVDLYRFLLKTVRPRRQRPTVFQIPEHENLDPFLVSAMMPFTKDFDGVFKTIKSSAKSLGLSCRRADDMWEDAAVIQDVVSLIDRSKIVVCDCSGRNANVFYEIGIAHTLGRDVILVSQSERDIPFDLRHLRYIQYLNNAEGLENLGAALRARMQTLIGH